MFFDKTARIALCAGLAFFASQANAAVTSVTQLIHFDDANNGDITYSDADKNFLFDPINLQSGNCADSTNGGNGSCFIEAGAQGKGNGTLTTMVRLTGDKTFSLDAFYFYWSGTGNSVTVTPDGDSSLAFVISEDSTYTNVFNYSDGSAVGGKLTHNTQYVVDLTGLDDFKNISSVVWTSPANKQTRIDCVVATFEGSTTEPLSGFKKGCGTSDNGGGGGFTPVPLPAGLPLILSGIGIFAALRLRSRKAA